MERSGLADLALDVRAAANGADWGRALRAARLTAGGRHDEEWGRPNYCLTASISSEILTLSPTRKPPAARATFQFRPKSLRLMLVWALNPATSLPNGVLPRPVISVSRTTSRVMPLMVRSPITRNLSLPARSTRVLLKVMAV